MAAMSLATVARRWAWGAVLAAGTGLYLVLLKALEDTQDPNLVPSLVFLAGSVVPATFVAARPADWQTGVRTRVFGAFVGGLIGTAVAARLPFETLIGLGPAEAGAVALVEEAAKLVAPAVALGLWRMRRDPSRGLAAGMAIGAGFAALETMGQAFTTLLNSQGNVDALEHLLFLRGLLAPAANAAWTGLACGALWRLAGDPRASTAVRFAGTFVAAVVLHALWDGLHSVAGYLALSAVSVAWLLWELHRAEYRP
jgi:RsiW-degrading membrane proteinase PrsW (M82 family)